MGRSLTVLALALVGGFTVLVPSQAFASEALGVDCKAFLKPPAERASPGPGRPPKMTGEEQPIEKRTRGRTKYGGKEPGKS
jgi:hypothetical protein